MCNLLGDSDFDVDVVISVTIATDPCDALPREEDPLVCLDPSRDLQEDSPITVSYWPSIHHSYVCRCVTERLVCPCVSHREVDCLVEALCPGRAPQYSLSHRDQHVRVDVCAVPSEHWALLDPKRDEHLLLPHRHPDRLTVLNTCKETTQPVNLGVHYTTFKILTLLSLPN